MSKPTSQSTGETAVEEHALRSRRFALPTYQYKSVCGAAISGTNCIDMGDDPDITSFAWCKRGAMSAMCRIMEPSGSEDNKRVSSL